MTKKRNNLKQLFLFNGLLLVLAFILIQYSVFRHDGNEEKSTVEEQQEEVAESNNEPVLLAPKSPTVNFEGRANVFETPQEIYNIGFTSLIGKDMTLDDFKGQWVILNFWASWCPPCIVEMPSLQELQDDMGGQGVKVIGIGLDRNIDGPKLRQIMQRYNFGPIAGYYSDWPTLKQHLEINTLPTTYILAPNGMAVAKLDGQAEWSGPEAKKFLSGLMN